MIATRHASTCYVYLSLGTCAPQMFVETRSAWKFPLPACAELFPPFVGVSNFSPPMKKGRTSLGGNCGIFPARNLFCLTDLAYFRSINSVANSASFYFLLPCCIMDTSMLTTTLLQRVNGAQAVKQHGVTSSLAACPIAACPPLLCGKLIWGCQTA